MLRYARNRHVASVPTSCLQTQKKAAKQFRQDSVMRTMRISDAQNQAAMIHMLAKVDSVHPCFIERNGSSVLVGCITHDANNHVVWCDYDVLTNKMVSARKLTIGKSTIDVVVRRAIHDGGLVHIANDARISIRK